MKLNVMERLLCLEVLPKEGNFATIKQVRKLRESLSFTDDELKKFKIAVDGNQIGWDPKLGLEEVDIQFGDFASDIVKSKLKKMSEENKLEEKHLSLYDKFVEKA